MAAVYDIQVRNALYEYERALVRYPISIQRRKIKVKQLRSFLQALSRNVDTHPICNSKKLGQFFDVNGNPIFPNLKQGNYEDESGTQWRMSFFRISTDKVKIYRLYQSVSIDESKLKKKLFIENNTSNRIRLMNTNRNVVRLTESKLRNMIDETVRSLLNEISYKTYSDAASAAADRESIFKDHPGYPETPMRRSYDDGNKLDKRKYERDAERQMRQSRQPEKFKKAAYTALSREICGEDDFGEYVRSYINNKQVDDRLIQQIKQYKEGEKHIMGNNTKWSARNGY